MKREININELSDGKRYGCDDMVRTDTHGCMDCHLCCTGMGESIILDPYDVFQLSHTLNTDFSILLSKHIELHVVDSITLPNLRMEKDSCTFLNQGGRCSIHDARPGFCRLFPLGRIYENDGFSYILQIHECPCQPKSKVKVQKWIGIPNIKKYEAYVLSWHDFLRQAEEKIMSMNEETVRQMNLYILQLFFMKPYVDTDFYEEYDIRLKQASELFSSL